jgi:glucose/arabinose dehydrogenase
MRSAHRDLLSSRAGQLAVAGLFSALLGADRSEACELVDRGYGAAGATEITAETVVSGLEVPWGIGFLPGGDLLVTERPGRVRLVRNGRLVPQPVAQLRVRLEGEAGLLGIAIHPQFADNRSFYLYYSTSSGGRQENRVERWRLSSDHSRAEADRLIVDHIPGAQFHNGGRLRFGPDGMLYIGTGDALDNERAQDRSALNGKLLRVDSDGAIPADNPFPGSRTFLSGLRNPHGFDWTGRDTLYVADHGPTGELRRSGLDEISVARAGDNLGWPLVSGCDERAGTRSPLLSFRSAMPPGGASIYRGTAIPGWTGDFIVGSLRAQHLHRVRIDASGQLVGHEVYLDRQLGRLRDVVMGPDGHIYVTTSNCDGRGRCPGDGDRILRIVPAR